MGRRPIRRVSTGRVEAFCCEFKWIFYPKCKRCLWYFVGESETINWTCLWKHTPQKMTLTSRVFHTQHSCSPTLYWRASCSLQAVHTKTRYKDLIIAPRDLQVHNSNNMRNDTAGITFAFSSWWVINTLSANQQGDSQFLLWTAFTFIQQHTLFCCVSYRTNTLMFITSESQVWSCEYTPQSEETLCLFWGEWRCGCEGTFHFDKPYSVSSTRVSHSCVSTDGFALIGLFLMAVQRSASFVQGFCWFDEGQFKTKCVKCQEINGREHNMPICIGNASEFKKTTSNRSTLPFDFTKKKLKQLLL